jgi:hypothetical protein
MFVSEEATSSDDPPINCVVPDDMSVSDAVAVVVKV